MPRSVTGLIPGGLARHAALIAGLDPGTGVSSLIRAAIAMYATGDIKEALASMERRSNAKTVGSLSRDADYSVSGYIGDYGEALANVPNKSQAIRAGLAMMAGWDKEDALTERFVRRQGRPEKAAIDA